MGESSAVYALCTFLMVMLSRSETDGRLTEDVLHHNARLLNVIKSYEIIKPYRLEGRKKRHASTKISSGHLPDTTIVFRGKKRLFHLDISLNKGLFSPQFEANYISNDDPKLAKQLPHEHCFYHGTVKGEENSDVSLSTCDGIEGIIQTDDGTFFLQPLKSQDGQALAEHVIFNADDVTEQPATCGHSSHKRSLDKEIHHSHSTNFRKRVRRNVLDETKYVELFIINDKAQFDKYGIKTELRAKQLANHLDSIYRLRKIRIALVKVETWRDGNRMTVDRNASKALSNFLEYKKKNLDKHKGKHFDYVQLITGLDFDGTAVGYAPLQSICGKRSAAVVQDYSNQAAITASTMAHELGHNFGMIHDQTNCECPDPDSQCIMSSFLSKAATRFSTCSINTLKNTLEKGYAQCLFDEPMKLHGDPICGNGFVEEGEQCDCGTPEECDHFEDKCCNATTCMLLPGAACSHGECCENCQLKEGGTLCRAEEMPNDCDLPEYCTGKHETCPEDHHVHDGISCHNNEGYCYGGICRNVELQCQLLFGKDIKAGHQWCFDRNARGNHFFNCHNETNGYFACPKKDVNCGRINCLSDERLPELLKGQDRTFIWATLDRKTFCIAPVLSWGDGRDPQYVEDGTKCGNGKMCLNSRCIPLAEAVPTSAHIKCPFNCSGNGVCNSNGNCHCNEGFACPYCKELGQGGSVDSGQGCHNDINMKIILSYSMPVGQKTKNGEVEYKDTNYTGVIINDFYKNGTGILTDGKFGPVEPKSKNLPAQQKGKGWVGWNDTTREYIDIVFEFFVVRKFKDVTLTVNVDKKRSNAVFSKSQIFFAATKDGLSGSSFLQYCPSGYETQDDPYNAHVILSLCENTARFIMLRLYFGATWLLITEISFNSDPTVGNVESSLKSCSENGCIVTQSPTSSTHTGTSSTTSADTESTVKPNGRNKKSTNSTGAFVAVAVIVVILMIVLVVGFLLYRRRQALKLSTNVLAVEMQSQSPMEPPTEPLAEPSQNIQNDYEVPTTNDDAAPVTYEEVQFSPPTYTELNINKRNKQKITDNNTYQKLLKPDIEYAYPTVPETAPYENVQNSPANAYTELDTNQRHKTANGHAYQKLLKYEPDYVIPADGHHETEPYEEVGKEKTPPGYTELDENQRHQAANDHAYQKLLKYNP